MVIKFTPAANSEWRAVQSFGPYVAGMVSVLQCKAIPQSHRVHQQVIRDTTGQTYGECQRRYKAGQAATSSQWENCLRDSFEQ